MTAAPLAGAWDIHVHTGPSLFPRWGDGRDLVRACEAAKMAGVVLKAHHGSTVESAALLHRRSAGLQVLGGVTLNHFVGGLNPQAVAASLALGGRVVWLPTIHAEHHGRVFGQLGGFPHAAGPVALPRDQGLSVLDAGGRLLPAMQQILELLDGRQAVLGTGHLSFEEILALRHAIRRSGVSVKLLVNHVFFTTPQLGQAQLQQLVDEQVYVEVCFFTLSRPGSGPDVASCARVMAALPEARWILASDSGQAHNPPAPECLGRLWDLLLQAGVDSGQLERMLRETPQQLLGT